MSEPLTTRQQEVLDYLRACRAREHTPSYRDVQKHLGMKSVNGAATHIRALASKGLLTFGGGKSRGIRLTEPSPLERAIKLLKAGVGANPADIDAFLKETERHGCEVHGEGTTDAASSWQHDEARSRLR
jgi:SOS-response transcriptional repressor LexA